MRSYKNRVLIFRNQLFKVSETFIVNQAGSLKNFVPVYVGRKLFGAAPDATTFVSLDNQSILSNIAYVLFRDVSIFKRLVVKYKPVLIHAHFGVEGVYGIKLAQTLNIPLVTTFHGFDATTTTTSLISSAKPAWINYALYKKQLINKGDLFICVSEFIRKKVIEMGFPEDKTITHYIGIDVSEPPPKKVKMPYEVILHVARLTEKKGTKYLIKAFSQVVMQFPDTKLVIIGGGPLMQELKDQVGELKLIDKVVFLGSQPNLVVMEWMAKADIFCLPSVTAESGDSEGLGMVFLEAASAQLPIIGTDHGGIPEAVIDGKTGFLVPEKSVDLLAQKLSRLLSDDVLRTEMGKNGRQMIEEKFNLKVQTKKLEELYKLVLS